MASSCIHNYAREWVVIVTNNAYMMTTPEYKYVMANFKKVMGGDLYDNDRCFLVRF